MDLAGIDFAALIEHPIILMGAFMVAWFGIIGLAVRLLVPHPRATLEHVRAHTS